MQRTLNSLIQVAVCLTFMLGVMATAQDKKADAAGVWKWEQPGRDGGEPRKFSLKIKVEGEKVTGTLTAPGRQGATTDVEIKEAKVKGDELSFQTTQERGGNSFTSKYVGKITGDTLKGTIERPGRDGGEARKTPWEAKREKAK
jgi:hypothetical protein